MTKFEWRIPKLSTLNRPWRYREAWLRHSSFGHSEFIRVSGIRNSDFTSPLHPVSRPENPVSRIPQSRQNIAVLVELPIDCRAIDRHFRMLPVHGGDPFRRC